MLRLSAHKCEVRCCSHLVHFFYPFLFRSLTASLFLTCLPPARPFAMCRVAPRGPRPQPPSATRCLLPPLALGHSPFSAWDWDMTRRDIASRLTLGCTH